MTLEKLGAGIDFVADTTPAASDAIDGDVYLDTSLSPPEVKVFDASAGSFARPQTAQNLDQKVSNAGIDWSSKTPEVDTGITDTTFSVSGSGYLISVFGLETSDSTELADLRIDGVSVTGSSDFLLSTTGSTIAAVPLYHRFDSSFQVEERSGSQGGNLGVAYVLD
jgi:hypothetical protein